jgi:hypothetical protein
MQVLLDENTIECNIYELLICRYCMSKQIIFLLLMFHIFYSISTTKFEFVKRQYLHESIQTLKFKNSPKCFGKHSHAKLVDIMA